MRPAAAFGKPFTYLAAAPPPSAPAGADHRPSLQQQLHQTAVPASVLHTFAASNGGVPPTPPVRTSTATAGKQKPPPVPPRGETTRLTTVPAKKPEQAAATAPQPPAVTARSSTTVASSSSSPSPAADTNCAPAVTAPSPPPPPPPPSPPPDDVQRSPPSPPPPPPAEPDDDDDEDLSASALISRFENGCGVKQPAAAAEQQKQPLAEVDSGTSTLAESTDDDDADGGGAGGAGRGGGGEGEDDDDDDDDDGAADIWVRTIESPVKNVHPQKTRHHSDSAIKAGAVAASQLTEKRGSLPADASLQAADASKSKAGSPPLPAKDAAAAGGVRSSFRASAGSRCSSPAPGKTDAPPGGRKISAAEALGVVAKPCPRVLPSSASLDAACRRQSLGNLAESRFGALLTSSLSRSSWAPPSGVQTDVESTQSEPSFDYRRKKFTKRCSSADGRNPVHHHHHHHHYHTLQSSGARASAARDPDFGAKRAFIQEKLQEASAKLQNSGIVPSGLPPTVPPPPAYHHLHHHQQQQQLHNGGGGAADCGRPPRSSSCNCGQHQATSRPMFVNKRTASAEELLPPPAAVTVAEADRFTAAGRPVSASSSSSSSGGGGGGGRGSYGRSLQRVTFALDQQQQLFAAARPMTHAETGGGAPSLSSAIKKPFKSNLKVKDVANSAVNNAVPELNVLGTSAINTRLPPQHPHPYGLPYKLPVVNADVLQGKGNPAIMKTLHKPKVSH